MRGHSPQLRERSQRQQRLDRSSETDRTRRFATVVTQRTRSRGQSPQLRDAASVQQSWIVPSEPIEPEDSRQSLLSEPGSGDNPRSFGNAAA
ncbi:MAG UNVERIFIED_CONTAM: hypothetical protein LVR18_52260 [Planctomycetaceae bacterium]